MKRLILTLIAVAAFVAVSCESDGPKGKSPKAGTSKTINGIETVYIPAGTFLMGSPEAEPYRSGEEFQHSVTLTKGYYMGKYEITNAQYCEFLNEIIDDLEKTPEESWFKMYMTINGTKVQLADTGGDIQKGVQYDETKGEFFVDEGYENHPMIFVTWYGASEYAAWAGGALPTEAQWEYACRGGQTESLPFGIGDGTKLIDGMASFDSEYPYDLAEGGHYEDETVLYDGLVAVGSYTANAWGLYDMHGNVEEWCSDWYRTGYFLDNQTDPAGPESGDLRICRGGGYCSYAEDCRSAQRRAYKSIDLDSGIGFRVVFDL